MSSLAIAAWLGRHRFDRLDLAGYLLQDTGKWTGKVEEKDTFNVS
jgi:hypothetical protein